MKHNSIIKKVRLINLRNLILPLIILAATLLAVYYFPFAKSLKPYTIDKLSDVMSAYKSNELYIEITVPALYHTGQEHSVNGRMEGQYYYTLEDGRCYIFLFSNAFLNKLKDTQDDLSELNNVTVKAGITDNSKSLSMLMTGLARELDWSASELMDITCPYIIDELDFNYFKGQILIWIYRILITTCIILIVYSLLCIIFPYLDRSIFNLRRYGRLKEQLKQAEHEMSTDILLRQGDFIITEHFLINLSDYNLMIIPLEHIIWTYKFSSYHILRYRRRKITYTLFILGTKKLHLRIPYLSKTDANTILSYLSTAYPDTLVGYRKEYEQIAKTRTKMATR